MTKKDQDADATFIRALAELVCEKELAEIQVKRDYGEGQVLNVRVSRQLAAVAAAPVQMAAAAPAVAPSAAPAPASNVADAPAAVEDPAKHPGVVNSPMVGTAYLRPEPGAAPFITVGESVKEGQTVLIVEAMKTMNQIPAPRAGKVTRILIEDSSPVEYGSPLIIIE